MDNLQYIKPIAYMNIPHSIIWLCYKPVFISHICGARAVHSDSFIVIVKASASRINSRMLFPLKTWKTNHSNTLIPFSKISIFKWQDKLTYELLPVNSFFLILHTETGAGAYSGSIGVKEKKSRQSVRRKCHSRQLPEWADSSLCVL